MFGEAPGFDEPGSWVSLASRTMALSHAFASLGERQDGGRKGGRDGRCGRRGSLAPAARLLAIAGPAAHTQAGILRLRLSIHPAAAKGGAGIEDALPRQP
jgi:hypothetical protein